MTHCLHYINPNMVYVPENHWLIDTCLYISAYIVRCKHSELNVFEALTTCRDFKCKHLYKI